LLEVEVGFFGNIDEFTESSLNADQANEGDENCLAHLFLN